jgi:hypothetical protein
LDSGSFLVVILRSEATKNLVLVVQNDRFDRTHFKCDCPKMKSLAIDSESRLPLQWGETPVNRYRLPLHKVMLLDEILQHFGQVGPSDFLQVIVNAC